MVAQRIIQGGTCVVRQQHPASDDSADMLLVAGPKALAKRRRVSVRTLRRQFVRAGTTLSSYLRVARRQGVVVLLRRADLSFEEVAKRVGLSSAIVLVRFVHREFGATPGALRQRLQVASPSPPPLDETFGEIDRAPRAGSEVVERRDGWDFARPDPEGP